MEIYLDHPEHGAMVVYSEAEAKLWEPKGWKPRAPKLNVVPAVDFTDPEPKKRK